MTGAMKRFFARFDTAGWGVALALVPLFLTLLIALSVFSEDVVPEPCKVGDFGRAVDAPLMFYLALRWELLKYWALPFWFLLAVVGFWRAAKGLALAALTALAISSFLDAPAGVPATRWLLRLISPDCPEEDAERSSGAAESAPGMWPPG